MKMLASVDNVTVTFGLPDWFGDRFEYTKQIRYPSGHVWAGQVDREECGNSAVDALFHLKGVKEVCYDPQGKWVNVEFSYRPYKSVELSNKIEAFRAKLNRFLNRYKEAK